MQKVYLVLRNNQQTGPFTIDELLQQQLRPSDLVWVEGNSHAWSHPSEIGELKLNAEKSNNLFFSERGSIEERAEQLRQRVRTFTPVCLSPQMIREEELFTHALRTADSPIVLIDHRKKEIAPLLEWTWGVLVALTVVGGVYGGFKYFGIARTLPSIVKTTESKPPEIKQSIAQIQILDTIKSVEIRTAVKNPSPLPKRKMRRPKILPVTKIEPAEAVAQISVQPLIQQISANAIIPLPHPIVNNREIQPERKGIFKKKKKNREHPEQETTPIREGG